jgi:transposase-like protein
MRIKTIKESDLDGYSGRYYKSCAKLPHPANAPYLHPCRQHVRHLKTQSEDYRPKRCPHCGVAGLWCHGFYTRKANRRSLNRDTDEPILIPRFRCQPCHKTCSCLPEVIPPRRHYLWDIQQLALWLSVQNVSLNLTAQYLSPSRHTLRRWWQRCQSRFSLQAFHLRSSFSTLGRSIDIEGFWLNCLQQMTLSQAMLHLYRCEVIVP